MPEDPPPPPPPPPQLSPPGESTPPSCISCAEQFRVELCDLATGRVKTVPDVISMDWQTTLNDVGRGTLTVPTLNMRAIDIWPHRTSVYILRTAGPDGASPANPVVEFAGIVEQATPSDNGSTRLGMKSIEHYLQYREIVDDLEFGIKTQVGGGDTPDDPTDDRFTYSGQVLQTEIAAALVNYARPDGIPLSGASDGSGIARYRFYDGVDKKPVLEAVTQLSDVINGPDWYLVHRRDSGGAWSTEIHFTDEISVDTGVVLRSDREANGYSLSMDASNHATHVWAAGSGDPQTGIPLESNVMDPEGFYPRFDGNPSWSDVSVQETLDEHAEGFLADNRDPLVTVGVSVAGLEKADPSHTKPGHTVDVDVNYGAVTFRGKARILSVSWKLADNAPVMRSFDLYPVNGNTRDTVFNQTPGGSDCEECG